MLAQFGVRDVVQHIHCLEEPRLVHLGQGLELSRDAVVDVLIHGVPYGPQHGLSAEQLRH